MEKKVYKIDSIYWEFPFGMHKGYRLIDAIEITPSSVTSGIKDIHGETHQKGFKIQAHGDIVSYLLWAEREKIVSITADTWDFINLFDKAVVMRNQYLNGSSEVSKEQYEGICKEIDILLKLDMDDID